MNPNSLANLKEPWKPGDIPNPTGRPKTPKEIRELISLHSVDIVNKCVELANKGDTRAIKILMDRISHTLQTVEIKENTDRNTDSEREKLSVEQLRKIKELESQIKKIENGGGSGSETPDA